MTVAWGLLSTAAINLEILQAASETREADVLAVASRDRGRADAYAREHGLERSYASYEGLLEDPDVQALYISLPNGMHAEWTIRALEAGKHVLCEKPFSRRPADVERAFDLAESSGLVLCEAFMWRHHPQTKRLAQLVEEGAVGELRLVRAAFSFPLYDVLGPGDTRLDPALDGGSLMDLGCYCVSAIRLLGGEPERVSGEQLVGPSGVDVGFAATLRCGGRVLGELDCGFVHPSRAAIEVVGSTGTFFVAEPWHPGSAGIELRREGAPPELLEIEPANSYRLELEDVAAAIRGERPPLLGRADALGQARTIEALYRAASEGAYVELDQAPAAA